MTIHEVLKQYWGYDQFRPLQEEIITSALSGKDTLALLPTGGGKSICFQVPALTKEGICIVVSPLIALMKDQVENLQKRDIKAQAIYSGMSFRQINFALDNCIHGDYKFLYLSPERLKSEMVLERIKQMQVNLLAVDEAHCISQWGYDFRPEYLQIADVRQYLPSVPVLALTASATPDVVKDIQQQLKFPKPNVFVKSFERSNIAYVVNDTEDKDGKLTHILSRVPGTALVYVRNRKKTQEIAQLLNKNGIRADFYHAGLPHEVRIQKQENWIKNHTRVMACTNAFGMGIDKPDVRLVVHYEVPDSLESYYQEAGRAGRDEQKSYCVLLFNAADEHEAIQRLELSYPEDEQLMRVYQALCNYYSVPQGASPERSFDFEITDFVEKFKLDIRVVYPALKLLEQCDLILLNEGYHEPSKLRFVLHHDQVYKFQVENPTYDDFIKLLLRSYGGLFDQYVLVDEQLLAKRVKQDAALIIRYLNKLTQLQVLDYQPRKEKPQLIFLQNRVTNDELKKGFTGIKKRKQVATDKLKAMLSYANNDSQCRSKKIVAYFDEYGGNDCGVCDVCLQKKKMDLSTELFEELIDRIKTLSHQKPIRIHELVESISEFKEEKIAEAVRYLLDNDKLHYNTSQELEWKK